MCQNDDLAVELVDDDEFRRRLIKAREELITEAGPNAYPFHAARMFGREFLNSTDS